MINLFKNKLVLDLDKHFIKCASKQHRSASSAALTELRDILNKQLVDIQKAGIYQNQCIITSPINSEITIEGHQEKLLNFCANNYLGLASDSSVLKYTGNILRQYGAGLSSVRFICGTQDIHKNLENKLAQFHGREVAILYASCFNANGGLFDTILTPEDAVFWDELNHASSVDGIRLCKAQKQPYKHRDMNDLETHLRNCKARVKLIATDGVFSVAGHITPLKDILFLAKKYQAVTFIDESHATGILGQTGRGTEEYYNVMGSVDIINSTLGKALGGAAGGYTTGPKELITLLRQKSRPYLFSNSLPPATVAIATHAIDMLLKSNERLKKLHTNTKYFRQAMTKAGFILMGEQHPICPIMLGDARLAFTFANEIFKRGIYAIAFGFPVVPEGQSRIRVQISAAHTIKDIDRAIAAFIEVGKSLNVV